MIVLKRYNGNVLDEDRRLGSSGFRMGCSTDRKPETDIRGRVSEQLRGRGIFWLPCVVKSRMDPYRSYFLVLYRALKA